MISVIIPVYDRINLFKKALDSVCGQSYKDIQIIIVDDGSEIEIKKEELKISDKIDFKIFRQENKGAPSARNKGFGLSTGDYVIFWDADITGRPDMLEKMYMALQENTDASYSYSNFYLDKKKFPSQEFDPLKLKKQNYITTASLIRRENFSGFDESLKRFQDWDLWLTMLEQGKKGVWIDEYLFTLHSGGTMSKWLPSFAYKKPWKFFPWFRSSVEEYERASRIIFSKHKIII